VKPPAFHYHDPRTVSDVVALLAKCENAKLLAGGQSLMPMLNMRYVLPDDVIDLNKVDALSFLREAGDVLEIGAMTRQRELEYSDSVARSCPLMREAILNVGHRQTRNRGTLAGSLCHLDPSAELVSVATAMGAIVHVAGPKGERKLDFADFPFGYMIPSIEADELVTQVDFPCWPAGHGFSFVEFARRHGDFAIASVAVLLEKDDGGKIKRAALALGGVAPVPVLMRDIEEILVGQPAGEDLFRAAGEVCRKVEAVEDANAPSAYRQHLAAVLCRRALTIADVRMSKIPKLGNHA
jgi:carbon-monoxide dehydrogenase medium subunit